MEQFVALSAKVMYLFSPLLSAAARAGIVRHYKRWTTLKRLIGRGATFRGQRMFDDDKNWRGSPAL